MMRGEPLVRKVALLAKYVIFPGAMIASLAYCPPDFNKPNKRPFDPAQPRGSTEVKEWIPAL